MISAFKRLVNSNGEANKAGAAGDAGTTGPSSQIPSQRTGPQTGSVLNNGMHMISQSLQKKFSRGVNYNMKIVIRGDNNTGKSTLWTRLQGQAFKEQYETSEEIKVANIQWNYKSTEDVVKVEIWDVVDRSKKKKSLTGGSTARQKQKSSGFGDPFMLGGAVEASLDAEFIDVYKNANGCLMVFDITKPWTWDYVERELPKVPSHIPVLVIGNFRDKQHHRQIDELKCKFFLESLDRGSLASSVRYTEASMRSGFGLKYLHKFFNVPFLQLQRESLMQQLETNAKEMDAILEDLSQTEDKVDDDYALFTDSLNSKRRQESELNAGDVLKNAKSLEEARKLALEREARERAKAEAEATEPEKMLNQLKNKLNTTVPGLEGLVTSVVKPVKPQAVSMSVTVDPDQLGKVGKRQPGGVAQLQDYKPPEDDFDQFLANDSSHNKSTGSSYSLNKDPPVDNSDEDEDAADSNPMVASFKEEIDSEDEDSRPPQQQQQAQANLKFSNLSDEEENEEEEKEKERAPEVDQSAISEIPASSILMPSLLTPELAEPASAVHSDPVVALTSQDFDFLESMTASSVSKPMAQMDLNDEEGEPRKEKKKKSKSSKAVEGSETDTASKKKSKKEKKSKSKEDRAEKKKKRVKERSDSEDEANSVSVKRDEDYEEL